ncbi:hypothetical protein [Bacillus thuringiensis]|uniref:hypothetical protein n=1 Tax=Bacillus thuringiensis TaxID=1428 RepID=UPI000BFB904A|nr:hypothetical protein [Bacillus thuringiensis]PGR92417.1 hypothetical protein COC68_25525 [Bacillus thuringiensis]
MKFLEQHPNYTTYTHEKHDMSSLPFTIRWSELNALVHGCLSACPEDEKEGNTYILQHALATELQASPCEYTNYGYMKNEIVQVLIKSRSQFSSFMDGLSVIIRVTQELKRINEFLQDNSIGYIAEWEFGTVRWRKSDGTENQIDAIDEALETPPNDFQNTKAYIKQAIIQLHDAQDKSILKDKLRDALSAIEAYVKYVSGEPSIYCSVNILEDRIEAPNQSFIREGAEFWRQIHEIHPDIRHRNDSVSDLELPEALYYIERLMCYLEYIHRKLN